MTNTADLAADTATALAEGVTAALALITAEVESSEHEIDYPFEKHTLKLSTGLEYHIIATQVVVAINVKTVDGRKLKVGHLPRADWAKVRGSKLEARTAGQGVIMQTLETMAAAQ